MCELFYTTLHYPSGVSECLPNMTEVIDMGKYFSLGVDFGSIPVLPLPTHSPLPHKNKTYLDTALFDWNKIKEQMFSHVAQNSPMPESEWKYLCFFK